MQAVKARQMLEPIFLPAERKVGGKQYWRIEFFNDDSRTSHADILRVLSLAQENIIANIIKGDQLARPHRRDAADTCAHPDRAPPLALPAPERHRQLTLRSGGSAGELHRDIRRGEMDSRGAKRIYQPAQRQTLQIGRARWRRGEFTAHDE